MSVEHGLAGMGGYFLGAIPFGIILTKLAGAGDLRQIGSGNIGATNVLRTGHKGLAALTLFLDIAKGVAAVLLAQYWGNETLGIIAGIAAFAGHLFPIWLRFRGGKGVATALGVMAAWSWPVGIALAVIWLCFALVGRYSSLAALAMAGAAPLLMLAMGHNQYLIPTLILTAFIVLRHRSNIERLLRGTEPRIGNNN